VKTGKYEGFRIQLLGRGIIPTSRERKVKGDKEKISAIPTLGKKP